MKFTPERLQGAASAIFTAAGCDRDEAELVARYLVKANLVGHDSHGIIRVPQYVEQLAEGRIRANQSPSVVSDAGATVILDANLGFGQVMGEQAVDRGVRKARQHGVSLVGLRNVAHLGRLGDWAERAAEAGVISLHFVNILDGAWVAPFGGRERRLSTNPLACGIPVADGPPIVIDFATCTVAEGKIRVARNKGLQLPEGSILDRQGRPSTDPNDVYDGGAILPIAGHKGHALAIMVDLLAGTLTGGGSANPEVVGNRSNMLSLFVDPAVFADAQAVAAETRRFVDYITSSAPVEADGEVLMPGEIERRTMAARLAEGIEVDQASWDQIVAAAGTVRLEPEDCARWIDG